MPRNKSEMLPCCPAAINYAESIESGDVDPDGTNHDLWMKIPEDIRLEIARERYIRRDGAPNPTNEWSLHTNAKIIRERWRG